MSTTTSQFQAPMELLGAHPGINIIDPSTVLTRLWYFDGKFLRASGFRTDQEYVRSLVALTNQANGNGVVHGLDAALGNGDIIAIDGGLAVAPSGRVIYLPSATQLSIALLIARSTGTFSPQTAPITGTADFALCPPDAPANPDDPVPASSLYVLTVAAADALCGEEERFGQLCEDACAAESDRSVAVEGACFQVHQLQLTLPLSELVQFTGTHLRSQVASAYFEAERHAIASRISGAGLQTSVWCAGADGVGSEEVPLAVFNRNGTITSWVDMWTARRELIETTPHRYWGWRFAMRPLDVFLAQVLQFQCQLLALGGGPGLGEDPCADERTTLEAANQVLATLLADPPSSTGAELVGLASVPGAASIASLGAAHDRLAELSVLIANTLAGNVASKSGSALIDGGIQELPSGGYLFVNPTIDLQKQVRAYMGPGVDLRFCIVRPDFIPEALQEAQHMERISLTQGIDDPGNLEEVDILVPGGSIETFVAQTSAFEGLVRYLPDRTDDGDSSAINLRIVAREHVGESWSWTIAGFTQTADELDTGEVFAETESIFNAEVSEVKANRETLKDFESRLPMDRARMRMAVNRNDARMFRGSSRAAGAVTGRAAGRATGRAASAPLASSAAVEEIVVTGSRIERTLSTFVDFEIDRHLGTLLVGESTGARLRATAYYNLRTGILGDAQFSGQFTVISRQETGTPGTPSAEIRVRTTISQGFGDLLAIVFDQINDPPVQSVTGVELEWRFSQSGATRGVEIISNITDQALVVIELSDSAIQARHLTGELRVEAVTDIGLTISLALADFELDESPGVLDVGSIGRDLGESVIDVITAELVQHNRDAGFSTNAYDRLFGTEVDPGATMIVSDADWVMFHRRRTKVCGLDDVVAPTAIRRYRWHHADLNAEQAKRLQSVLDAENPGAAFVADAVFDEFNFQLITTVEFPEMSSALHSSRLALRTAWSSKVTATELIVGAVASPPTGDGAAIALGRLNTATGAISDITGTTGMMTYVAGNIPPQFQATGVDGVILTAGRQSQEVDLASARLVRVGTGALDIIDRFEGSVTFDEIGEALGNFEPQHTVVQFEGNEITNRDEMTAWWDSNPPIGIARFAVAPATSEGAWAPGRSNVINEHFSGNNAVDSGFLPNFQLLDDPHTAVFFLIPG